MVVMFASIFITMFSRNYLGVHTPQDVLVGFGATVIALIIGNLVENWSDKNPAKRDIIILISGIVIAIILVCYYEFKTYPMDYLPDGSLLVDGKDMIPDSFEGIGFIVAFSICRIFERRGFDFEKEMNWKSRFVVGTIALIPIMWWDSHIVNICVTLGSKCVGKFLWSSGIIVYAMIIVPLIMKKVHESGIIDRKAEKAC